MDAMEPRPSKEFSENVHAHFAAFADYAARFPLVLCSKGCTTNGKPTECRAMTWDLDGPAVCSVCEVTGGPPRTVAR